jgi:hypothetical protein
LRPVSLRIANVIRRFSAPCDGAFCACNERTWPYNQQSRCTEPHTAPHAAELPLGAVIPPAVEQSPVKPAVRLGARQPGSTSSCFVVGRITNLSGSLSARADYVRVH